MTLLAANLRTIRKNLNCTQMIISEVLDVGFRTYVRYEAGERDAPVALLIKIARLGNISLDRLLTTLLTPDDFKTPDLEKAPITPQKLEVIGGGIEEGRVMFKGLTNDHLVTKDKLEKDLLLKYRGLNRLDKGKYMVDIQWILNNPKNIKPTFLPTPRILKK